MSTDLRLPSSPPQAARRQCLRQGLSLAAGACGLHGMAHGAQGVAPPALAPWPAIRLLDGRTWLPESWAGQVGVLVFWATTCPFCRRHNAHVDKLFRASTGLPLRVLGVALDTDADAVRRYMAQQGYAFPVTLLDAEALRARWKLRQVIPMTCVVGRDGALQQAIAGEMFEEDVLGLVKALKTS